MTKRSPAVRISSDIVLLWFACAIALGVGWYIAFALLGSAIDTQYQLTGRVWSLRLAQTQKLAERPELEREERALDNRLRALDLRADKPKLVASFIRDATRIAVAQRVNLDGVDERGTAPTPAPAHPLAGSFTFESIPLDVSLSGSYSALLAAVSELARAPVTMQIDIAALERNAPIAGAPIPDAPLAARLHIVLQRLTDDVPVASAPLPIPEDTTTHARPF